MDLVQIKYFLALSRTLNFTRAADFCHVTQPALSRSIQRLEDEMGGRLILRERDLTQLTELGRLVLPRLQQIADAAEDAGRVASAFRCQDSMPLRIGMASGVATSSLAPVLRELSRRMPGVTLTVRHGGSRQVSDWLLASEIDVGLTADGGCLSERAIQWPLFDDTIVALVSEDHQLAGDGPLETERIWGHVVLGRIGGDGPLDSVFSRLAGGCKIPVTRHLGATEEHINEMVAAGLGIGLSTERQPCRAGILRRPIWPPEWLTVCVATMPGRPCSPAARTFVRLARDCMDYCGGAVHRKAVLTMAVDNTGPPVEGVASTREEERNGRTSCAGHFALSAADWAG